MSSETIFIKQEDHMIKKITDYLNTQIMDDQKLVETILAVGLSAYTDNPLNLMIKAPTSEGKTYAATRVLGLFPSSDVLLLGGMSPTALVHEQGELVDENFEPLETRLKELHENIANCKDTKQKGDLERERNEVLRNSKNLVNLDGKILLFLDTPNWELWRKLKPILSHDARNIEFKVTDRKSQSLHTKSTVIRGWPAVVYCSAKNEELFKDWEEIQTRFLIKSPNTDIAKYKKANLYTAIKYSTPSFAQSRFHNDDEEMDVRRIVKCIKDDLASLSSNCCFNPFGELIANLLPSNEGSTMRIAEKFFSICNLFTQINSENRCKLNYQTHKVDDCIFTDISDIENALTLMDDPNKLPPHKIDFVVKVFKPSIAESIDKITTTAKLAIKYTQVYGKPITPKQILENYLDPLQAIGIVEWSEDQKDHRLHLYKLASDLRNSTFDGIKSKIIEYSNNNPSYVQSRIMELPNYSSEKGQMFALDPQGNMISTEDVQKVLLSEHGHQTNILYSFH